MNIQINGKTATAADISDLRSEVVVLRNKMLGPDIFDAHAAVVLSHVIYVLGDLQVELHRDR